MTPHPNMSRLGRAERTPLKNGSSNGIRADILGGGDPFGGRSVVGLQEGGEIQKSLSHPSFRGSRLSTRPILDGAMHLDKAIANGDRFGDFKKGMSPEGSREPLNGHNSALLVVTNGTEQQNNISNKN